MLRSNVRVVEDGPSWPLWFWFHLCFNSALSLIQFLIGLICQCCIFLLYTQCIWFLYHKCCAFSCLCYLVELIFDTKTLEVVKIDASIWSYVISILLYMYTFRCLFMVFKGKKINVWNTKLQHFSVTLAESNLLKTYLTNFGVTWKINDYWNLWMPLVSISIFLLN